MIAAWPRHLLVLACVAFLTACAPTIQLAGTPMAGFAGPPSASYSPWLPDPASRADEWAFAATLWLFEGKMRALFSMLFGASMLLFVDRAEAQGHLHAGPQRVPQQAGPVGAAEVLDLGRRAAEDPRVAARHRVVRYVYSTRFVATDEHLALVGQRVVHDPAVGQRGHEDVRLDRLPPSGTPGLLLHGSILGQGA